MGLGVGVPTGDAIHYAQRMRRMDKDYGWVHCDQLLRTTQYLAVSQNLDWWRVLEFVELKYLLNKNRCPAVEEIWNFMLVYPALFKDGIGWASELFHYGNTPKSGGGEFVLHQSVGTDYTIEERTVASGRDGR